VQTAKMLWGWLATAKVLARREGHDEAACPCCGQASESNWHMFGSCVHPALVTVRRQWASKVQELFMTASFPTDIRQSVLHLWRLDEDGCIPDWVHSDREPMADAIHDEDTLSFATAVRRARKVGPQRLWSGLVPAEWNQALAGVTGTSLLECRRLSRDLARICRDFGGRMWLARNGVVHDNDGSDSSKRQERERVCAAIARACQSREDLPDGLAEEILDWPTRRQKAWLRSQGQSSQRRRASLAMPRATRLPGASQTRLATWRSPRASSTVTHLPNTNSDSQPVEGANTAAPASPRRNTRGTVDPTRQRRGRSLARTAASTQRRSRALSAPHRSARMPNATPATVATPHSQLPNSGAGSSSTSRDGSTRRFRTILDFFERQEGPIEDPDRTGVG
jgi:hypothetical protein